ncbi:uncharacterized protein LOC126840564 isoform X3 [Adelges cooleyi]|uniref:uncharacterized protein LOC126840564 isoform X3 n=1 Tax=Adelges cooleyi TaxID=133065 RepID=UPI00218054A5|nr:uncharacterized protein LOC126840564 isoform X3 [Adelges cooleyi]
MLKSFYGCCPLRNGVGIIAIFNFIWNAYSIIYRSFQYIIIITSYNNRDFETFYNDTETIDNDPVETSTEKSDIWANSSNFHDMQPLVEDNEYDAPIMSACPAQNLCLADGLWSKRDIYASNIHRQCFEGRQLDNRSTNRFHFANIDYNFGVIGRVFVLQARDENVS